MRYVHRIRVAGWAGCSPLKALQEESYPKLKLLLLLLLYHIFNEIIMGAIVLCSRYIILFSASEYTESSHPPSQQVMGV